MLEETPTRATKLLTGISAVPTIRTVLYENGMTDDEIKEGRALLLDVLAAPLGVAIELDTDDARAQRLAIAELDQWDEPNFLRYSATLERHFPEQGRYIFKNLTASTGTDAVEGVATLLGRIAVLEAGTDPDRATTKAEDKKAVVHLAKRRLSKAERSRLMGLVDTALGPTSPLPAAALPSAGEARRQALIKLRAWYDEWASTARAVIKKRSYLIRLGLATRRPAKKKEPAPPA